MRNFVFISNYIIGFKTIEQDSIFSVQIRTLVIRFWSYKSISTSSRIVSD